jgi:G3E family GTPase
MNLSARLTPAPGAIPVNIITGTLGSGKTTAIARLLANKAPGEYWLVILNEFTDTGIDTLTLAAAARGAYDVRMIPGGCLCCTGEEDFRRQLSGVLSQPAAQWPTRILIEPSGIGHPGAIVEELRLFERGGAIHLASTIALLDAQQQLDWSQLDELARAQVDAADVLLLSKAELADATRRQSFLRWARDLFPRKRLVDVCERGVLPPAALAPPQAAFSFEVVSRSLIHQQAHQLSVLHSAAGHEPAAQFTSRQLTLANSVVQARAVHLLNRHACGWIIPSAVLFDLSRLQHLMSDASGCWRGVDRLKAVLRTGIEQCHLLQRWGNQHSINLCNWSQDSRIEVQLAEGEEIDWTVWDQQWQLVSEAGPTT